MSINRVVLAGVFSFPEGQAASSRILNLTRGFMDHLEDVQVISAYHKEDEKEFHGRGTFEFQNKVISHRAIAPFLFTGSRIIERIKIRLTYYRQIRDLVNVIIEELRGDEEEMIFLYGRSYSFLNLLLKKIKNNKYKTKVIFDVVEPPRVETSYLEYVKHPFVWESVLVFKRLLHKFDACTFITHKLHEEFGSKTKKYAIVPSVLYQIEKSKDVRFNQNIITIGYLGALIGKDYPELLYETCLDLHKKNKTFKLVIIGRFRKFSEGRSWEKTFLNSPFKDSIELHFNPNEKTKMSLINSVNFIVLFRKQEPLQAYTFPTRVVEALGLGKVLIMNDFGDLSRYFVDGENSILLSSKLAELNSDNIIKAKNNEVYCRLAKNGVQLLQNEFSASLQTNKILKLFK